MVRTLGLIAICLSVHFGFASTCSAGVLLISNLPGEDNRFTRFDGVTHGSDRTKFMGFELPNGPDYLLSDVTLRLKVMGDNIAPDVRIFSNTNDNLPGDLLVNLVNPTFGDVDKIADYSFTPAGPLIFEAGQAYWIGVSHTGDLNDPATHFQWMASQPGQEPSGIATHFGSQIQAVASGSIEPSEVLNSYAVSGSVVPEPASLAVWSAMCVVGFGWGFRRRRMMAIR